MRLFQAPGGHGVHGAHNPLVIVIVIATIVAVATITTIVIRAQKDSTPNIWTVTVYYTAVERFHDGATTAVTGCPQLDCSDGDDNLGTYPETFVSAVEDEGTGHTNSGKYLNWSYDTGFWLDDAPRDTTGDALIPFETAAADPNVLPAGTQFDITDCGHDEGGEAIASEVCDRLRTAHWTIRDEFTPGLGGERHIDVYIGEETGRDFTNGPWYVTLTQASLQLS